MSKSNASENDFINFTFNKVIPSWMGTLTTTGITDFYISLHTADPGEAGDQETNEATYTSYARVAVVRTSSGWTVAGNQASNAALIQFPQCTGGTNTITHVSIGTVISGTGEIIYSGALNASLAVSNGIQPQFSIGALIVQED
jgi:hypothetical protein